MRNIHLHKNTYLAITNDENYFTYPIDMDIMNCLIPKGYYYSLSGGLYPIHNHTDCPHTLYFKNDIHIKSFCPISVNNIASNYIVQLNPNQYLLAVIKRIPIECNVPETKKKLMPTLAMINLPKGCKIYSTDFIIPAVNSFSTKLPMTLWGYQLDPFINTSDPLIPSNCKIMSDFGLNNLTQNEIQFYS